MGRDEDIGTGFSHSVNVSTHAPLWGATHASHLFVIDITVSTHAPLWGATVNPCMILNQIA